MMRPTYAEVDLSAIRDNIKVIRKRVGPKVRIMPAVKANGYGHGAIEVSRACVQAGVDALCVATPDEGVELRDAGFKEPVLILGCSPVDCAPEIVRHDLASTVSDLNYARAVSEAAVAQQKTAGVHIKVDTGMGRIGVAPEGALAFARLVRMMPGLKLEGVFTHFPCADEEDRSFTLLQIAMFTKAISALKFHSIPVPIAHAANSAGIMAYPESYFNAVRPGIMIYGGSPCRRCAHVLPIREAMTLKTRIVFLKEADAGTAVGYGRTYTLKRRSKVATLPIGYADGYQRALSNRGEAAVRGTRVPLIGRVCMDQIMIDVTDVEGVSVGDEVILIGGGYEYLSADNVAEKAGTISDETFTAITSRVPRVYINP
ncbi:MAG: alanine racemase [Armatimonadota bacterium]|jgi:alanine racemase